jgi:hypothetical protein
MNDTDVLNWIERNVFEIREDMQDNIHIAYYDSDGKPLIVHGVGIRAAVHKANDPDTIPQTLHMKLH